MPNNQNHSPIISNIEITSFSNTESNSLIPLEKQAKDLRDAIENGYEFPPYNGFERFKKLIENKALINFVYLDDGQTPLHLAAERGRDDIVTYLLEQGADTTKQDTQGQTALHVAMCGDLNPLTQQDAFIRLIADSKNKGILDAQDNEGQTAWHKAAKYAVKEAVFKYLLAHGVNVTLQDQQGQTALHLAAQNLGLSEEALTLLLTTSKDMLDITDNNGQTALHVAVKSRNIRAIICLLKHGATMTLPDKDNRTALQLAAQYLHLSALETFKLFDVFDKTEDYGEKNLAKRQFLSALTVFEMLFSASKPEKKLETSYGFDETTLYLAVKFGRSDIVKYLIVHDTDMRLKNVKGQTTLHMAVKERDQLSEEAFSLFVEAAKRKAILNIKDNTGQTALHVAAKNGDENAVGYLIGHQIDATLQDNQGQTALHLAAANPALSKRAFVCLMMASKYMLNTQDNKGALDRQDNEDQTALHVAVKSKHEKAIEYLLVHGADVTLQDNQGQTALHWAAKNIDLSEETLVFLVDMAKKEKVLDIQDKNGQTALHVAAENGDTQTLKYLLKQGADVTLQDNQGRTALHSALYFDSAVDMRTNLSEEALLSLVIASKNKDALNKQDNEGQTALHMAVKMGSEKAIEYLLTHGADATLQDNQGRTALHWLAEREDLYKLDIFKRLVVASKNALNHLDRTGMSALYLIANHHNNHEACQLLLQEGANPYTGLGEGKINPQYINHLLTLGVPVMDNNLSRLFSLSQEPQKMIAANAECRIDIAGLSLTRLLVFPDTLFKQVPNEASRRLDTAIASDDACAKRVDLKPIEVYPPYIDVFGKNWLEEALKYWEISENLKAIKLKITKYQSVEAILAANGSGDRFDLNLNKYIIRHSNTLTASGKIAFIENLCEQRRKEAVVNFDRAIANLAALLESKRTIFIQCLTYLKELPTEDELKAAINAVYEKLEAQYPWVSHAQIASTVAALPQVSEAETSASTSTARTPSMTNPSTLFTSVQADTQDAQAIAQEVLKKGG